MSGGRGPSRSQQAFRWLLSGDGPDDAPGSSRKAQQKQDKKRPGSGGRRSSSERIPGFRLRDEAGGSSSGQAAADSGLASLREMFEGLPADLVRDVLASCGGDMAAAAEALLAMTGGGAPGSSSSGAQVAADGGHAAEAAGAGPAGESSSSPDFFYALPTDIKRVILDHLSLRDLARAARTCQELAAFVRDKRRHLKLVTVPEGVSLRAARSLVAAFAHAHGVSLSRCRLRFDHEYADMLAAVKLGEADRITGVPVSHLCLANCQAAGDAVVLSVCDTLGQLRRMDLSGTAVTDAGLRRLAAYSRQADDEAAGGEGEAEEDEEVAAAFGDLEVAAQSDAQPRPAVESPAKAVKRIAAQRHAASIAAAASAGKAQHGRPLSNGLEELCLKGTSITERGAKLLLQPGTVSSKSLKVLDVSRCPNLGDLDVHPRCVVEVLSASGCNALRSVVIQLPPEAPLRHLRLDSCRQLHDCVVVAPRLESLNASHCGQLRVLRLLCRRLRDLQAVNSGVNLAASELDCPALESVNFFGCRLADAEGLEAAAASLENVRQLDLTGCTALSRVYLPGAGKLAHLRVGGCSVLREVTLASPMLEELVVSGCSRLMTLRLGSASQLKGLDLENCAHLREVQLEASGFPANQQESDVKRRLVTRGCTALPAEVKAHLRAAVLGKKDD